MVLRGLRGALLWTLILMWLAGCSAAPQMVGAEDVLRQKREGVDDSALLVWVQEPSRSFNLTEGDLERLKQAGINEVVIAELRFRSEMHRRSIRQASERRKPAERGAADSHKH